MNQIYSNHIKHVSLVVAPFFLFGLINGVYNSLLARSSFMLFWLMDIIGWIILPSTILYYLYRYYGIRLHDYGLFPPGSTYQRREILIWSLIATAILSLYYFSFGWLAWRLIDVVPTSFSYGDMVPNGNMRYVAIFYLAITAAVFEEIFYRGLIWRLVYSSRIRYNKMFIYVIVSSSFFGLVHWENGLPEVVAAIIFGIVACVLYLRWHNLLPLMVAHFFIDIVNFW